MENQQNNNYKEIEGFSDWSYFYKFIASKYEDVSYAFLTKKFENIRDAMRELIDNTIAYHSNKIEINNNFIYYHDYFETLIEKYYKKFENIDHLPEQNKSEIVASATDEFMQESRKVRREIMKDIAIARLTPTVSTKKIKQRNEEMEGVGV